MANENFLAVLLGLVVLIVLSGVVFSDTQHLIPIQGKAEDISGNLLAMGNLSVRIYEVSAGGSPTYSNIFLNAINNGIYDIQLSLSLNNTKKYYLELDINGEEVVGDANGGRQEFYPGGGDHTHTHQGLFTPTTNTVDSSSKITYNLGNVGIGVTEPMERLHIADGHVLLEGGGQTQFIFKRDFFCTGGPSGGSTNPMFKLGRITCAGDNDTEFRALYADDQMAALGNYDGRTVFEFDQKGIVASVQPMLGSHFEGFLLNDSEPHFRLNSWPSMQLEMGPGGKNEVTNKTDVAIRRSDNNKLSFITGRTDNLAVEKMVIDGNGNVGIGTANPDAKLNINLFNEANKSSLKISSVSYVANKDLKYGIKNEMISYSSSDSGQKYGIYNDMQAANGSRTGIYSRVMSSGTDNTNAGIMGISSYVVVGNPNDHGYKTGIETIVNAPGMSYGIKSSVGGNPNASVLYGGYFSAREGKSNNHGLYAEAFGNNTYNYGIHAKASGSNSTNYAGYFEGNVTIIGTVESSQGYEASGNIIVDTTGDLQMNNLESNNFGIAGGYLILGAPSGAMCNNICSSHGLTCNQTYTVSGGAETCSSTSGTYKYCWCE